VVSDLGMMAVVLNKNFNDKNQLKIPILCLDVEWFKKELRNTVCKYFVCRSILIQHKRKCFLSNLVDFPSSLPPPSPFVKLRGDDKYLLA
jgi:hypothetical protein